MDFPNATHSIFVEDEIVDLVVESKNLKIEDDIFNSDINLLDCDSLVFSARAILLIDPVGLLPTPISVAGVSRRAARRTVRSRTY